MPAFVAEPPAVGAALLLCGPRRVWVAPSLIRGQAACRGLLSRRAVVLCGAAVGHIGGRLYLYASWALRRRDSRGLFRSRHGGDDHGWPAGDCPSRPVPGLGVFGRGATGRPVGGSPSRPLSWPRRLRPWDSRARSLAAWGGSAVSGASSLGAPQGGPRRSVLRRCVDACTRVTDRSVLRPVTTHQVLQGQFGRVQDSLDVCAPGSPELIRSGPVRARLAVVSLPISPTPPVVSVA